MPLTVTIHMLLALLIVNLLIYLVMETYYHGQKLSGKAVQSVKILVRVIWVVMLIQILLGTEIRSEVEILRQQFPLLMNNEILQRAGVIQFIHALLGIILAGGILLSGVMIMRLSAVSELAKQSVWSVGILIILQLLIGFSLQIIGVSPLLQVFHLWIASIIFGFILVLHSTLTFKQVSP